MADYAPSNALHETLTSDVADTINWQSGTPPFIEILNRSDTHTIYFRIDGTEAEVEAEHNNALLPLSSILIAGTQEQSLISEGAAAYSLHRVEED